MLKLCLNKPFAKYLKLCLVLYSNARAELAGRPPHLPEPDGDPPYVLGDVLSPLVNKQIHVLSAVSEALDRIAEDDVTAPIRRGLAEAVKHVNAQLPDGLEISVVTARELVAK